MKNCKTNMLLVVISAALIGETLSVLQVPPKCLHEYEQGNMAAAVAPQTRYHYNNTASQCQAHTYYGTSPITLDENAFPNVFDCMKTCIIRTRSRLQQSQFRRQTAACTQPKQIGPCKASFQRWYYNNGQCETFTYGGCRGNSNNFVTKQQCEQRCKNTISLPSPPPLSCAAVTCIQGSICKIVNGLAKCTENPCNLMDCAQEKPYCILDENNEAQCVDTRPTLSPTSCSRNEQMKPCSSPCEKKCSDNGQTRPCLAVCGPPACQCVSGHSRDYNGRCVPDDQCEAPCAVPSISPGCDLVTIDRGPGKCPGYKAECGECAANEQMNQCSSPCEKKCSDNGQIRPCLAVCGPPACQCKRGHSRDNNGRCVPDDECQESLICKPNESVNQCGNLCEGQCANGGEPVACIEICAPPACECNKGYFRHNNGTCVPKSQCSPPVCAMPGIRPGCKLITLDSSGPCPKYDVICDEPECKAFEIVNQCGNLCERKCSDNGRPTPCPAICGPPACVCAEGYMRDNNGRCVKERDCKNEPTITCANVLCTPGTTCEMENNTPVCKPRCSDCGKNSECAVVNGRAQCTECFPPPIAAPPEGCDYDVISENNKCDQYVLKCTVTNPGPGGLPVPRQSNCAAVSCLVGNTCLVIKGQATCVPIKPCNEIKCGQCEQCEEYRDNDKIVRGKCIASRESCCPNNQPLARCFANPCDVTEKCAAAKHCKADYCGGCFANFYDAQWNAVKCPSRAPTTPRPNLSGTCAAMRCASCYRCDNVKNALGQTVGRCFPDSYAGDVNKCCPAGIVNCFADPCQVTSCKTHAHCVSDYCGGCNAVLYDENWNKLDSCPAPLPKLPTCEVMRCGACTRCENLVNAKGQTFGKCMPSPYAGDVEKCCPAGIARCILDPCTASPCSSAAHCRANYCGGCNRDLYDANWKKLESCPRIQRAIEPTFVGL